MKILLLKLSLFAAGVLLLLCGCVYLVMSNSTIRPEVFVDSLSTDPLIYEGLEDVDAEELVDRLYCYDKNEFVGAIAKRRLMPNTTSDQGRVPAFNHDGDTFIITYKWVNFSRGLALSDDKNFIAKTEAADPGLTAWKLGDSVYGWDLELDSSKYER